ncbi:MAG TPA: hypothetical protein PLO78_00215 [Candidatus Omnitrophota bacterium]|nr:hypothetical protein [Candidatus Omnitrophota bacterium]
MKGLKNLVFLLIFITFFYFFYERLLGMAVEPFLEKKLTSLFNMPITITGLRIRLWPCHVHVEKFVIYNPVDFRRRDHFTAKKVDIFIDPSLLKNKFVRITLAHFKEAIFAVESYMTPKGSRTNVKIWYYHMGLDEDSPVPAVPHPKPPPDNVGEPNWRVRIDRLELENGTIVIDDRRVSPEERYVFKRLKGFWTGFDFMSDYISPTFNEFIKLEGTFGENPAAVFRGEGKCQFADGDNFDVRTEILEGALMEYDFLLEGLPGEVSGGTFDLFSKMTCVEGNLDSDHRLLMKSLKLTNPTVTQAVFKYSLDAVKLLLESHKTVELEIKVKGDIDDPKFGFFTAFTKAFQKALISKATFSLKGLGKGTLIIAKETPKQVQNSLGKLGSILTDPFVSKTETAEVLTEDEGP